MEKVKPIAALIGGESSPHGDSGEEVAVMVKDPRDELQPFIIKESDDMWREEMSNADEGEVITL